MLTKKFVERVVKESEKLETAVENVLRKIHEVDDISGISYLNFMCIYKDKVQFRGEERDYEDRWVDSYEFEFPVELLYDQDVLDGYLEQRKLDKAERIANRKLMDAAIEARKLQTKREQLARLKAELGE